MGEDKYRHEGKTEEGWRKGSLVLGMNEII